MAKNNVTIKVGSDTAEAEKGLKKVSKDVETLSDKTKEFSKTSKSISDIIPSVTAVGMAANVVIGTLKKINAAISESVELSKIQTNAEKQLEVAARNNPFLNAESVQNLKNYARNSDCANFKICD